MSGGLGPLTPTKAALGAGLAYLAWRWWRYGPDALFPSLEFGGDGNAEARRLASGAGASQGQSVTVYVSPGGATYAGKTDAPPAKSAGTKFLDAVERVAGAAVKDGYTTHAEALLSTIGKEDEVTAPAQAGDGRWYVEAPPTASAKERAAAKGLGWWS